uniref:Venom redulysin protein 5 n=1 Tax=Pristhesancus plagipennis TaxID=1955184 RepID=A0A1Q1NPD2_PRIPG|nr:venom redulysin protein 5 [Pristhesancus plagipennis]
MSKLWLVLLLVAAFQAVHSYPAYETDYLEDAGQSTWGILKDTFGKLKDLYTEKGKEALAKLTSKLKEKLCNEKDFEEDFEEDDQGESIQLQILQKLRELLKKLQEVKDAEKAKIQSQIEELKAKICDKLDDIEEEMQFAESDLEEDESNDGDEERFSWGNVIGKFVKKAWKKLKPALKKAVKKGADILKKNAVKVTPFECDDKTCKTCINLVFLGMSACMRATISREDKITYFTIAGEVNDSPQFEEKIKLGDVPRCVNAGSVIGKLCIKGVEGKGKSSQGQAQVNFCLGFLAEQHNVGAKVCATYENKKFKIKLSPELFAGALDDNGDIIVGNEKNASQGVVLDADEFEID